VKRINQAVDDVLREEKDARTNKAKEDVDR
jgi:hypothetical protein